MQTELLCRPDQSCFQWRIAEVDNYSSDELPTDPRTWSRDDVSRWLHHMSELHDLQAPRTERFHMNGKALCLMNMVMFLDRVPLGGKLLYKDFQLRLGKAMYARC